MGSTLRQKVCKVTACFLDFSISINNQTHHTHTHSHTYNFVFRKIKKLNDTFTITATYQFQKSGIIIEIGLLSKFSSKLIEMLNSEWT